MYTITDEKWIYSSSIVWTRVWCVSVWCVVNKDFFNPVVLSNTPYLNGCVWNHIDRDCNDNDFGHVKSVTGYFHYHPTIRGTVFWWRCINHIFLNILDNDYDPPISSEKVHYHDGFLNGEWIERCDRERFNNVYSFYYSFFYSLKWQIRNYWVRLLFRIVFFLCLFRNWRNPHLEQIYKQVGNGINHRYKCQVYKYVHHNHGRIG